MTGLGAVAESCRNVSDERPKSDGTADESSACGVKGRRFERGQKMSFTRLVPRGCQLHSRRPHPTSATGRAPSGSGVARTKRTGRGSPPSRSMPPS
jgi:hypothetical protein